MGIFRASAVNRQNINNRQDRGDGAGNYNWSSWDEWSARVHCSKQS